jgi:hypothetical protein
MKVDLGTGTRRTRVLPVLVVAAMIGLLFLLDALTSGDAPARRTLTIDNQTDKTLQVELLDSSGSALDLGGFAPRSAAERHEILDQGRVWRFIGSTAGVEVQRVEMDRSQLEAGGWRVRFGSEP